MQTARKGIVFALAVCHPDPTGEFIDIDGVASRFVFEAGCQATQ
jgi:hypothetical protein